MSTPTIHRMIFNQSSMTQLPNKTENQKILTHGQNSSARWAVDSHHTRRNGQSGFQSVTQLLGFTHQTHRKSNDRLYEAPRASPWYPRITVKPCGACPWSGIPLQKTHSSTGKPVVFWRVDKFFKAGQMANLLRIRL